jgi:phospholipid/cholesterol/gamma-HCH transport system substrate-binding protein
MFVLGALGLVVGALAVFGSGRLFRTTHEFVIYFAGDVNGLRVGAPVRFKGVEIGQVSQIRLRLDQAVNRQSGQISADVRIPVIISLDEQKILSHGGNTIDLSDPHTIPNLIKEGMRAQLGMDSFVTGLLYVALDIEPTTPIKMIAPPGAPLQEIPSIPNALEQLQSVAVRIFEKLDKVDFNTVFNDASETLDSIKQIMTTPQLKTAVAGLENSREQLGHTMGSVQHTFDNVDTRVGPLTSSFEKTSDSAGVAAQHARITLDTVNTTIQPGSPLNYQALQTLQDVGAAARSIKELADYIKLNPQSLVRGRDSGQE